MEIKIFQKNLDLPSTRQVDSFEYSTPFQALSAAC